MGTLGTALGPCHPLCGSGVELLHHSFGGLRGAHCHFAIVVVSQRLSEKLNSWLRSVELGEGARRRVGAGSIAMAPASPSLGVSLGFLSFPGLLPALLDAALGALG